MKKIILTLVTILCLSQLVNAQMYSNDNYGRKTNVNNLYKDTDHDGVSNYYDRNDRNPNVTTYPTTSYSSTSYPTTSYTTYPTTSYSTYPTTSYPTYPTTSYPSYPTSSSRTVYTGPQGGQYYINSNGNKTYLKR